MCDAATTLTKHLSPSYAQAFFSRSDKNGVSLHSHLSEVIHKLLQEKPADALETFESISLEVKQKHFVAHEPGLKVASQF